MSRTCPLRERRLSGAKACNCRRLPAPCASATAPAMASEKPPVSITLRCHGSSNSTIRNSSYIGAVPKGSAPTSLARAEQKERACTNSSEANAVNRRTLHSSNVEDPTHLNIDQMKASPEIGGKALRSAGALLAGYPAALLQLIPHCRRDRADPRRPSHSFWR